MYTAMRNIETAAVYTYNYLCVRINYTQIFLRVNCFAKAQCFAKMDVIRCFGVGFCSEIY